MRELWKSVCATGVRPSGKNVPGKKRAPRHRLALVASLFLVHHFLRFVNPATDGLFIFFSVVGEEWQDKLKYFLAHRPHAFHMDDGEKLTVRLTKEHEQKDISGYLG